MKKSNNLFVLFKNMLFISTFTFGGGFAIVSLMKRKFVDELHWINDEEMLDIAGIAETCPGAIAVNAALLVGYRIRGFWGMIVACIATILPPITIISIISIFYELFITNSFIKITLLGMQAAVSAIIINAAFSLGKKYIDNRNYTFLVLTLISFIAMYVFSINIIYIIIFMILLGIMITFTKRKENFNK